MPTPPWANGAALPDPGTPHQQSVFGARQERNQFRILRQRYLTPGGTRANLTVPASASTLAVLFTRPEQDLAYGVTATPNWNTTVWVTNKATTGFTLHFGTTSASAQAVDLTVFRTES